MDAPVVPAWRQVADDFFAAGRVLVGMGFDTQAGVLFKTGKRMYRDHGMDKRIDGQGELWRDDLL